MYDRLGIKGLNERGESFYNPLLPGLVDSLMQNHIAEESEGAKVVFVKVCCFTRPIMPTSRHSLVVLGVATRSCVQGAAGLIAFRPLSQIRFCWMIWIWGLPVHWICIPHRLMGKWY